jgi:hypothetical protein
VRNVIVDVRRVERAAIVERLCRGRAVDRALHG